MGMNQKGHAIQEPHSMSHSLPFAPRETNGGEAHAADDGLLQRDGAPPGGLRDVLHARPGDSSDRSPKDPHGKPLAKKTRPMAQAQDQRS